MYYIYINSIKYSRASTCYKTVDCQVRLSTRSVTTFKTLIFGFCLSGFRRLLNQISEQYSCTRVECSLLEDKSYSLNRLKLVPDQSSYALSLNSVAKKNPLIFIISFLSTMLDIPRALLSLRLWKKLWNRPFIQPPYIASIHRGNFWSNSRRRKLFFYDLLSKDTKELLILRLPHSLRRRTLLF